MKACIITLLVCLMCSFAGSMTPSPDVTAEQIKAALPEKLEHPFLYFTEEDKPAIRDRIENDPVSRRIYAELKKKADSYLEMDSRPRGADIQALAFVYQMTDDKRYAQKAFEFLPDEYTPPGGLFDLNASRRCRGLAPIYDWLYTGLDESQRAHIRTGLENQINLVYGKYSVSFWAENYRINWNLVCSSSIGITAMLLLPYDESMLELMAKSYNAIYRCYSELGVDGDWTEGVGYWAYGTFVSLLYVDALNRITDGEFNLALNERFYSNPVTFALYTLIPPGDHTTVENPSVDWAPVNFQDAGHRRQDSTFGYNKIAELTGSREAMWLKHTLYGTESGDNIMDIIWAEPDIEPGLPAASSKHFRKYGWVVMRSDFTSADKVVLAGICGEHWDPYRESYFQTHGKLLAGHFALYWQGEGYLWDTGSPGYPRDYWTRNRWSCARANSLGHNVVHVNGEQQTSGDGVGGKVVKFRSRAKTDYAILDPTNAYPGQHLKRWRRHLILDKSVISVVLDEITASAGDDIEIRFHSACQMQENDSVLLIEGQSGLMALIPVVNADWQFSYGEHLLENSRDPINPWAQGGGQLKDRIVPYWDVKFTAQNEISYAATIILPVESLEEAKDIAASASLEKNQDGGLVLAFEKDGKETKFEFTVRSDGLVLK